MRRILGRATTIRARVAVGTFVLLALTLGFTGLIIDDLVRDASLHAFDGRLVAEAEALATLTRFRRDGRVELEFEDETMTAYVSTRSGAYFQVWTPRGLIERSPSLGRERLPEPDPELFKPLEGASRRSTHKNIPGPRGVDVRVQTLAVSRIASPEGDEAPPGTPRITVVVQVARELTSLDRNRALARVALATALPLALVLGTVGSFIVASHATAPVARLGQEAAAIGVGSLDGRLHLETVDGELRALAKQLNDAFDRLSAAIEREKRFSSDVAHELRTPLAVGRSTLELALLQDRSPEEYRTALRSALEASRRLEDLVSALLLLGRAEAARGKPELVDLRGTVASAIQALETLAHETRTPLHARIGEEAAHVRGDPVLLDRLVSNLVENALRHGGATREGVEVVLEVAKDAVTLSVLDRGPGFSPDLLARPFERFARGDRSRTRATGGAGLGLAIVNAIARAYGGAAALENRADGGATVRVRLPRAAPNGAPQGT